MKKIPDVTPLQFLVLSIVGADPVPGKQVREQLARSFDKRMALPTFYDLMSRLEKLGFIEGWYEQRIIAGQGIKERYYRITAQGSKVWEQTRDFFANTASQPGQLIGEV